MVGIMFMVLEYNLREAGILANEVEE